MKRLLLTSFALASLAFAAPVPTAQAAVSVGVSINSGNPYRGLSLSFRSRPDLALIPSSQVYYASNIDQDLYQYGDNWYYTADDCWYTARSYRGPFVQIGVSSVPFAVSNVPAGYRRHWGGASRGQGYGYGNGYGNRDQQWGNQNQYQNWGNNQYQNRGSNRGSWNNRNRGTQGGDRGWNRGSQRNDRGGSNNWGSNGGGSNGGGSNGGGRTRNRDHVSGDPGQGRWGNGR